ncbi:MAG: two-component system sensor histidine kinase PilS [Methylohalobius crimeensis]
MINHQQLRPCPFSKYRIQASQAWQLLFVFTGYQAVLSLLLCIAFQSSWGPAHLGKVHPSLFLWTAYAYFLAIVATLPFLGWRQPNYVWQTGIHLCLDLGLLPLLIYASGGLESGFGVLLAVSVVAAGILIGGRCALGFAALASIDVLAVEAIGDWYHAFETTHYTYAGMLGIAYFTIALLAVALAGRAEQSQALADQRKVDLANLEQLNEFIVQHLQSGIIVLDTTNRIRLINDSALRLLKLPAKPRELSTLPGLLVAALREWQAQPAQNFATLISQTEPIQARFSRLPMHGETLTMIFLEDSALHHQRVQESKLASLGKLTASIAHEIRNPLGAISHAGQLLGESDDLGPQDLRLVEIIQNHSRRVDEIIDNVLQLSRRNSAQRERLFLKTWLEQFCREFQETASRDSLIDLQLPPESPSAWADPVQLKQILSNLCGNAFKYGTPDNGKVILRLRHDASQKPCVEVIDRGPGIPADQARRIFEPFFTTSSSGTGLGLYIARELAQLNQAKLEYDFGPHGSCFRLTLANADLATIEL